VERFGGGADTRYSGQSQGPSSDLFPNWRSVALLDKAGMR